MEKMVFGRVSQRLCNETETKSMCVWIFLYMTENLLIYLFQQSRAYWGLDIRNEGQEIGIFKGPKKVSN